LSEEFIKLKVDNGQNTNGAIITKCEGIVAQINDQLKKLNKIV